VDLELNESVEILLAAYRAKFPKEKLF
jgi:hypothetical protein